jgi:hypothetical protein
LSRKKRENRRWTDPTVLVPIIVAIITAIVGPTYAYYYLLNRDHNNPPPQTPPTPAPQTQPTPGLPVQNSSLSVITDKNSYGFGDNVEVSGTVREPVQGKTVRLDVYNSKGDVIQPFNDSIPAYVPQSNIKVRPDNGGLFSYSFPLGFLLDKVKGIYKVEATYEGVTKNATFTVR